MEEGRDLRARGGPRRAGSESVSGAGTDRCRRSGQGQEGRARALGHTGSATLDGRRARVPKAVETRVWSPEGGPGWRCGREAPPRGGTAREGGREDLRDLRLQSECSLSCRSPHHSDAVRRESEAGRSGVTVAPGVAPPGCRPQPLGCCAEAPSKAGRRLPPLHRPAPLAWRECWGVRPAPHARVDGRGPAQVSGAQRGTAHLPSAPVALN